MVKAVRTVKIGTSDIILAFEESKLPNAQAWFQDQDRQARVLFELVDEIRRRQIVEYRPLSISPDHLTEHVDSKYRQWLEQQSFFFDKRTLSTGLLQIGPLLRIGATAAISGRHKASKARRAILSRFMHWSMDHEWKRLIDLANAFMRDGSLEQLRHEFWDMRGYSLIENAREAGWVLLTHLREADKRTGGFIDFSSFFPDLSDSVSKAREQMEIYDE